MPMHNPLGQVPGNYTRNNVSLTGLGAQVLVPELVKAGKDALFGRSPQDELAFQEAEKARVANQDAAIAKAKQDMLLHGRDSSQALQAQGLDPEEMQARLDASMTPEDQTMADFRIKTYEASHGFAPPGAQARSAVLNAQDGQDPQGRYLTGGVPLQEANHSPGPPAGTPAGMAQTAAQAQAIDPELSTESRTRAEVLANRYAASIQAMTQLQNGTYTPETSAQIAALYRTSNESLKKLSAEVGQKLGIDKITDPLQDTRDLAMVKLGDALQNTVVRKQYEDKYGAEWVQQVMTQTAPQANIRLKSKGYGPDELTKLATLAGPVLGSQAQDPIGFIFKLDEANRAERELTLRERQGAAAVSYTQAQTGAVTQETKQKGELFPIQKAGMQQGLELGKEQLEQVRNMNPLLRDQLKMQMEQSKQDHGIQISVQDEKRLFDRTAFQMALVEKYAGLQKSLIDEKTAVPLKLFNGFLNSAKEYEKRASDLEKMKAGQIPIEGVGNDPKQLDAEIKRCHDMAKEAQQNANNISVKAQQVTDTLTSGMNDYIDRKWGSIEDATASYFQGQEDAQAAQNRGWWMGKTRLIRRDQNGIQDNLPLDQKILPWVKNFGDAMIQGGKKLPPFEQFVTQKIIQAAPGDFQALSQYEKNAAEQQRIYRLLADYLAYKGAH